MHCLFHGKRWFIFPLKFHQSSLKNLRIGNSTETNCQKLKMIGLEFSWISPIFTVPNRKKLRYEISMNSIGNCCNFLQADSKANAKELAGLHSVWQKTPVYDRISKVEEAGLIKKYVLFWSSPCFFLHGRILVPLSLESQKLGIDRNHSARAVSIFPEVKECYLMGVQVIFY